MQFTAFLLCLMSARLNQIRERNRDRRLAIVAKIVNKFMLLFDRASALVIFTLNSDAI